MGREGFEQPCKSRYFRRRGCTGGSTPWARTVTFDTHGRARPRLVRFLPRVDRWPVPRLRDRLAGVVRSGEPGLLRLLDLGESFFGGRTEGRAGVEVGNVGDVAAVLIAVEDVDVVVGQSSASRLRA
jgi:hypothetical protein